MKRSALDRALQQVGAKDSGTFTLAQFGALLDAIQEKVEMSQLDMSLLEDDQGDDGPVDEDGSFSEQASQALKPAPRKHGNPVDTSNQQRAPYDPRIGYSGDSAGQDIGFDADDDTDEDGEGEGEGQEMSEEEAALEVYDELRGEKEGVLVADFLRWPELQDLLQAGALTREQLAGAMDECQVDVGKGERTELPFEKVTNRLCCMTPWQSHTSSCGFSTVL